MTDARSAILTAVSASLSRRRGGQPAPDPDSIAAEAEALRLRAYATRPDRGPGPLDVSFMERVVSPGVAATAERVAGLADFPVVVRRYLAAHGLSPSIALQPHPDLLALDWSGIETHDRPGLDEPVAVGLALGGIAETGSLVFHSGPDAPTLFAFLPVHHIVAVEANRLWRGLEDYADAGAGHPRNVNLVTGASGTTDIEGTLVRGAHGPGHLHVVLIGGAE